MTTTQGWIDQTRDMLLSGYVEELLELETEVDAAATTLTVTGANNSGIVVGVIIEIGLEAMYVSSVTGSQVSVFRGYGGSEPEAHAVKSLVRVSHKFPSQNVNRN